MYWSATAKLSIKPLHTVEAIRLVRPFIIRTNSRVMPRTMPPASMAPPKHMAQIISQIVPIMPAMPRVATSDVSTGLSVGMDVLP